MNAATTLAAAALVVAAFLFTFRVVRGPSLADRIVALDGLLTVVVLGIAVDAVANDDVIALDAGLVVALLAFVATGVVARFIERREG